MEKNSHGAQMLRDAAETIEDRQRVYGSPAANFQRIVRRWNTHIFNKYGSSAVQLDPFDVAIMMIDLKLARLEETEDHRDTIIDVAGYDATLEEIRVAKAEGKISGFSWS